MLQILPQIGIFQDIKEKKHIAAKKAPCKLERAPKCDYVNFGNTQAATEKYLEKARKLTLNDDLMQPIASEVGVYQLPANFFFAVKNSQSRHIVLQVPDFIKNCGLSLDKALKKIDKMANILRITDGDWINPTKFKLGDNKIQTTPCGDGRNGFVVNIAPGVVLKVFRTTEQIGRHGVWGETAIAREFTKAGVVDTPKLYLASANKHTGWMMTENINAEMQKPAEGLTHTEFLKKYGFEMGDELKTDNYIKDGNGRTIRVDFGGAGGNSNMAIIPYQIKTKLFEEDDTLTAFQDEGTLISAIEKHLQAKRPIEPEFMASPEGKFVQAYQEDASPGKKLQAVNNLDIVDNFSLGD